MAAYRILGRLTRVRSVGLQWGRNMSSAEYKGREIYHDVEKIVSASISAVSPPELVSKAMSFDTNTNILTVADREYHNIDK